MAKNYIKIFEDTVLKQSINQGTEEQREAEALGKFTTGELAYTRDTGRVFVGSYGNNSGNQEVDGGTLVGNKYLGMVDTNQIAYNADPEQPEPTTKTNDVIEDVREKIEKQLVEDARTRSTVDKKWDKKSNYINEYDAYTGDFMYDAGQNALILFDKNIVLSRPGETVVGAHVDIATDNESKTDYLKYKDDSGVELSTYNNGEVHINESEGYTKDDIKIRTPFINFGNNTDKVPDVYGEKFVVFRNIEPDGDTIEFVPRLVNTNGAASGILRAENEENKEDSSNTKIVKYDSKENNYSHNILKVSRVYPEALESALSTLDFFTSGTDGKWRIKTDLDEKQDAWFNNISRLGSDNATFTLSSSSLTLPNSDTIQFKDVTLNFSNKSVAGSNSIQQNDGLIFALSKKTDTEYNVGIERFNPSYYINLGEGLKSATGQKTIGLNNTASLPAGAPTLELDLESSAISGTYTKLDKPQFIYWTNHTDNRDTDLPEIDTTNCYYHSVCDFVLCGDENQKYIETHNKAIINLYEPIDNYFTKDTNLTINTSIASGKIKAKKLSVAYDAVGVIGNDSYATLTESKVYNTPYLLGYNNINDNNYSSLSGSKSNKSYHTAVVFNTPARLTCTGEGTGKEALTKFASAVDTITQNYISSTKPLFDGISDSNVSYEFNHVFDYDVQINTVTEDETTSDNVYVNVSDVYFDENYCFNVTGNYNKSFNINISEGATEIDINVVALAIKIKEHLKNNGYHSLDDVFEKKSAYYPLAEVATKVGGTAIRKDLYISATYTGDGIDVAEPSFTANLRVLPDLCYTLGAAPYKIIVNGILDSDIDPSSETSPAVKHKESEYLSKSSNISALSQLPSAVCMSADNPTDEDYVVIFEDGHEEVIYKYYTFNTSGVRATKTPSEITASTSILDGKNKLPDITTFNYNAVLIVTKSTITDPESDIVYGNIYFIQTPNVKYLVETKEPKEHKGVYILANSSATTRTSCTLDETVDTNSQHAIPDTANALILEIEYTQYSDSLGESVCVQYSGTIEKLANKGLDFTSSNLSLNPSRLLEYLNSPHQNMYTSTGTSTNKVYKRNLPKVYGYGDTTQAGLPFDHEIALLRADHSTCSIVEVPFDKDAFGDKKFALRICGMKFNGPDLSIRVIGYR